MSMSTNRKGCKYSYGYGKNFHSNRRRSYSKSSSSGGCFIATAAYETPMAEEIDVLRKWRDEFLMKSNSGKLFIKAYYKTSPPVANIISKSNALRGITRQLLKPLVNHLNSRFRNN